jgi:hypothetical protein
MRFGVPSSGNGTLYDITHGARPHRVHFRLNGLIDSGMPKNDPASVLEMEGDPAISSRVPPLGFRDGTVAITATE